MKQHISEERWAELSEKKQREWLFVYLPDNWRGMSTEQTLPSIGQMITFLGEDFAGIKYYNKEFAKAGGARSEGMVKSMARWEVGVQFGVETKSFIGRNLVDPLFEAVKEKLK